MFPRFQTVQYLLHPFEQRNAPPSINNGVIAGMKALINKASGTRITLLTNDPFATPQTTGNSRFARTPVTCWALRQIVAQHPAVFRRYLAHHGNIVQQRGDIIK